MTFQLEAPGHPDGSSVAEGASAFKAARVVALRRRSSAIAVGRRNWTFADEAAGRFTRARAAGRPGSPPGDAGRRGRGRTPPLEIPLAPSSRAPSYGVA